MPVAISPIQVERAAVTTAAAFVSALAWPITILLLSYLLRRELRAIARAIEGRIKSERSDISIGPAGLGISTKVEAIAAHMETLEVGQTQYGDLILQQLEPPSDTASIAAIPQKLEHLAAEYLAISTPDYAERVRVKDYYARKLGLAALEGHASRDTLMTSGNEAYILALASLVLFDPMPNDTDRLLRAAESVNRLHVRYYISLALGKLIGRRLVPPAQFAGLRLMLERFRLNADEPLLRRLDETNAQLQLFVAQL